MCTSYLTGKSNIGTSFKSVSVKASIGWTAICVYTIIPTNQASSTFKSTRVSFWFLLFLFLLVLFELSFCILFPFSIATSNFAFAVSVFSLVPIGAYALGLSAESVHCNRGALLNCRITAVTKLYDQLKYCAQHNVPVKRLSLRILNSIVAII